MSYILSSMEEVSVSDLSQVLIQLSHMALHSDKILIKSFK